MRSFTVRLTALLFTVGTSASAATPSVLEPKGTAASSVADLFWFFVGLCAAVFVIVVIAAGVALMRGWRHASSNPTSDRTLEVSVAAAVAMSVIALFVLLFADATVARAVMVPRSANRLDVEVIGHQWWWEFAYPRDPPSLSVASPNELHVPVGVPVAINGQSRDVIHSFWVPNLQGKRDLIPGLTTETWLQADTAGEYRGECAEFCGLQHAHMAFMVVAEPMPQFLEWLEQQRRPSAEPTTDPQSRGRDVFLSSTCPLCHTVRGTMAASGVGPDLTHLASRRQLAAGALPNTRGHLAGWVANSQTVKPGNPMPPNLVSPDDLQDLLAYLESLR